jgi:hypothetical protein
MTQRERAIVAAVEEAKRGEFGVTGFKIEFEAWFGRKREEEDCDYCDEGRSECSCCEGSGNHYCDECDERGDFPCDACEGEGQIEDTEDSDQMVDCGVCAGAGQITCSNCEGEGRYTCDDCDGEGYFTCEECGGQWQGTEGEDNPFVDEIYCHDFILEYLSQYGLAEPSEHGYIIGPTDMSMEGGRQIARHWKPKGAMAFSKVYYDATVDTEWTVTISVENKANAVLLIRRLGEAWKALETAVQNITHTETDITNAGMHITALNSRGAVYPTRNRPGDEARYDNFKRSMTLMMPALYFLASSCENTRGLQYRAPQISTNKYSAVHYEGGALEFRVFDTCYENCDQILDNIVVICNALKYWRTSYKRHYLDRVTGSPVYFGLENGYSDLKKMFVTSQHIDLLNRGLKLLKPRYYTVTELKKQRNFTITKRNTKNLDKEWRIRAEAEYKEYDRRIGWEKVLVEHNYIRRFAEEHAVRNTGEYVNDEALATIRRKAEEQAKAEIDGRKLPLEKFIEQKLGEYSQHEVGRYKLA